jgi:hypothetical protein
LYFLHKEDVNCGTTKGLKMKKNEDDLIFADPEFMPKGVDLKKEMRWYHYLNILGILRIIFGQVRDSSGNPNNVLGMVYASFALLAVVYWWVTHPEVKHVVDVKCPPISKKAGNPIRKLGKRIKGEVKSVLGQHRERVHGYKCEGLTVNVQIKAGAPPTFPPAFYYVVGLVLAAFLFAYFGRRDETREWGLEILYAIFGREKVHRADSFVDKVVEKLGGKAAPPPSATASEVESTTEERDPGGPPVPKVDKQRRH